MIITNSRYALVGYFINSYPTRAHGIIVNQKARNVIVGAKNLLNINILEANIRPQEMSNGITSLLDEK